MKQEKKQPLPWQGGIRRRYLRTCLAVTASAVALAVAAFSLYAAHKLGVDTARPLCLFAVIAGALLIGILAAVELRFIHSVTAPLASLTELARRISGGSYGIRAEESGDDEIGELTKSINEMSTEIARSERLQSEFVSSVSHELRTPLTAITGWAETLAYDEAIQGDSRRGLTIVSKEASRLTKMVGELLEFTRIQDGRFRLNMEPIDVAAELEDTVFTYSSLLATEGIELHYEPPEEDIPLIDGDSERLKQVFLNVLDNAAKHGCSNGGRIEVSLTGDAQQVEIRVRDFGRGIPADELPHVTERFYKGSSKERGSGIGLAICQEIISRHNGALTIENAAGGGVLVTMTLPTAKV